MKDVIQESYFNSINEIKAMKESEERVSNRISLGEDFDNALLGIHESEALYLEGNDSDSILVLQPKINSLVFESVKASAYDFLTVQEAFDDTASDAEENGDPEDEGTAEDGEMFPEVQPGNPDEVKEATDENAEDADEVQGDPEDEGTADEEERHPHMKPQNESEEEGEKEDEDEDEDEEEAEEVEEKDKDKVQESLVEMLDCSSYIIRKGLDEQGWLITSESPYFGVVQEAILEQLSSVCEAFGEEEVFEAFISSETQGKGISLVEAKSKPVSRKVYTWKGMKDLLKKGKEKVVGTAKKAGGRVAQVGKSAMSAASKNKGKVAAGLALTGGLAYGAKKLSDKKRNKE